MADQDWLVGFNIKYDLHWLRRYGVVIEGKKIWDCQLYHFMKMNQQHAYPSMDDVLEFYGMPKKLDVVKTEYWEKGKDTDEVPWELLEEYAGWDVECNHALFLKQYEEFQQLPRNRRNLILLHMRDLVELEEMEFNGMLYDVKSSLEMADEVSKEIERIDADLNRYAKPHTIRFDSDDELSAFLYGGKIKRVESEEYIFKYKRGGEAIKTRKVEQIHTIPRLIEPLPGTARDKEGFYETNKKVLNTLLKKAAGFKKHILEQIMLRNKLQKRRTTYCLGTPKLINTMGWSDNILHGNLNQCVVVTGRLSCTSPNLQNQDREMKICFISRYPWTS